MKSFVKISYLLILAFILTSNNSLCQNYQIIFHHYNEKYDTITILKNEKINPNDIPTSTSCDNANYPYFIGWTNDKKITNNTTRPTIIDENTSINNDLNLYPVFSNTPTSNRAKWILLKDISNLKLGDRIVIAASEYDYALSTTQNTNDRARIKITKNQNDSTITLNNDIQIITIENGLQEGSFAFNTNKGYLYAASNNKNYLKTKNLLDDNGSWNITLNNDTAKIISLGNFTHNLLRYNNASKIFSCYDAQKGNIFIYKETFTSDIPQYTICAQTVSANFHTNGNGIITINNIITGSKITEIDGIPTNINSFNDEFSRFVGWTTTLSDTSINNTKPQIITTITQNVDLYPVFSNEYGILINNVNSLSLNDQIAIITKDYNYAMSIEQQNNNRGTTNIIKRKNKIFLNDSIQIITLKQGTKENSFAFKVENGYLYASSNITNQLKTTTDITDNSSWTIDSTSTGEAYIQSQGANSYKIMRYDDISNQFTCYQTSKNKSIILYKKIDATKWIILGNINKTIEHNDTLNINKTQAINKLTIKSYFDKTAILNVNDTLYANQIIFEKTIDGTHPFFFSLPFNCNINEIIAINELGDTLQYASDNTNGDFLIYYYNQTTTSNNLQQSEKNIWNPLLGTNYTLKANQGYIINYFGKNHTTIKFPSSSNITIKPPVSTPLQLENYTWFTLGEKESTSGWNLIGTPYYTTLNNTTLNCNNIDIPYLTIPNKDGKTYTQTFIDNTFILPFSSFFIQLPSNHSPIFNIVTSEIPLNTKYIPDKISIKLSNTNKNADITTIINDTNSTPNYEIGKDLKKWIGYAEFPQIYTLQNDEILAFNTLPIKDSTVIHIGIYIPTDNEYTFSLNNRTINNFDLILIDKETNKTINLKNNNYTSFLYKGSHNNRFEIQFKSQVSTINPTLSNNIHIWTDNNKININGEIDNSIIYIYNSSGQLIHKTQNQYSSFTYKLTERGVYLIGIKTKNSYNTIKIIF